jgi:membrane-bound inhibitor of C-type lysozyme
MTIVDGGKPMLALIFLALASATPVAAQDAPEGLAVGYVCDGGAALQVAYLNPPGGDSYAVVGYDGRLIPMKAGPTGSGVRYVSLDGPGALVWHTKGSEGFLARDDAAESMLLQGCVESGG